MQPNQGAKLLDEDDFLNSFGEKQPQNDLANIFKATAAGGKPAPIQFGSSSGTPITKNYDPPSYTASENSTGNNLMGRNLANESISSETYEKKKTLFQKYIFDSYKYQCYFQSSTSEIKEKINDALWPFHPDSQPEDLVKDFENFKSKVTKNNNSEENALKAYDQLAETLDAPSNPFERADNEELSFIGRDLGKEDPKIKANHYQRNSNFELYGPIWIYITLVVEFVILGHLTNQVQNNLKNTGELHDMLARKAADQSLKRIMKISFFLGVFYLGVPFVTYVIFKGRQALEASYIQQLAQTSYSYVVMIPASLIIFTFQQYSRFKYLVLVLVWMVHLFYLYKAMYDSRKKYFDFSTNKQMAWFMFTQSFLFMWVYKSFFLQV